MEWISEITSNPIIYISSDTINFTLSLSDLILLAAIAASIRESLKLKNNGKKTNFE